MSIENNNEPKPHLYKIKYSFDKEVGEFKKEDIIAEGKGGCDAYIFASIIYPSDGSYSLNWTSVDPSGENLSAMEEFKAWLMMGQRISEKLAKEGQEARSIIAGMPFEMIKEAICSTKPGQ